MECHLNPSDYSQFSCTVCHTNPDTDEDHKGVGGYIYQDNACLACHPTGDADVKFDHNTTSFALTGAHLQANCLECHGTGFKNTPTECVACHQTDFDQSLNPKHKDLGLVTDCASCHTTQPGWSPARFDIHNNFYVLQDAHALIANDCKACHNGNYQNTPNTCVGCHLADYNNTKDPNHIAAQFPNDCASCHNQKPGNLLLLIMIPDISRFIVENIRGMESMHRMSYQSIQLPTIQLHSLPYKSGDR